MTKNLFSVPIFFIVFRETLESAIIVSVLLGLTEQIVHEDPAQFGNTTHSKASDEAQSTVPVKNSAQHRSLIRKLRFQVISFLGTSLLILTLP